MINANQSSASQVADGVAAAIQAMSVDALGALYASDVVIRHNFRTETQGKAENLESLRDFFSRCIEVAYTNIDRRLTSDGYVQQHDLRVVVKSGRQGLIPFCQVVRVRDGQISRLDEYLDPAAFFALMSDSD